MECTKKLLNLVRFLSRFTRVVTSTLQPSSPLYECYLELSDFAATRETYKVPVLARRAKFKNSYQFSFRSLLPGHPHHPTVQQRFHWIRISDPLVIMSTEHCNVPPPSSSANFVILLYASLCIH